MKYVFPISYFNVKLYRTAVQFVKKMAAYGWSILLAKVSFVLGKLKFNDIVSVILSISCNNTESCSQTRLDTLQNSDMALASNTKQIF